MVYIITQTQSQNEYDLPFSHERQIAEQRIQKYKVKIPKINYFHLGVFTKLL